MFFGIFVHGRRYLYLNMEGKENLCRNCIHDTAEIVVHRTRERAYYDTSESREQDLADRIERLVKNG